MQNSYGGGITKKKYINVSHGRIIYIMFLEQAVCRRSTKMVKSWRWCVGNIAMWPGRYQRTQLYWSKTSDKKKSRRGFSDSYVIHYEAANGHVNYLKIIIYCIPTKQGVPKFFFYCISSNFRFVAILCIPFLPCRKKNKICYFVFV